MKVLFHYDAGPKLKETIATLCPSDIEISYCPEAGPLEPFLTALQDADVIWHVLSPLTKELIEKAPKLKLIQKIGVGVNTIDLDTAKSRNVAVCNMPGTNSNAVAEMTLMLMLSASRRLTTLDTLCRSGQWGLNNNIKEQFSEIRGKTVGLVGFGAIPQILAPILKSMGANLVYHCQNQKHNLPYPYLSLEELAAKSDIISLHIPLTEKTDKLFNRNLFKLMKQDCIFVNTARGGLVDETDFLVALQSGVIGAAALDVFFDEPAQENNPLFKLDNIVVSPHVAWLTQETWQRSLKVALDNTMAIKNGTPLIHSVL